MNPLDTQLQNELIERQSQELRRSLCVYEHCGKVVIVGGKKLLNLAGNDSLGLSQHPRVKQAAIDAIEREGTGAGASRLVTGTLPIHSKVEREFAAFKHAPAALLFSTGYMANLAVLGALAGKGDLICQDRLNHASLIDAARISRATVRTFPHLKTEKLARLLGDHHSASPRQRRFIVTDSIFSMDGDCANLPVLCDLAERYEAVLVIDEAHATGVLGPSGAGLAEQQGVGELLYASGAGGIVISTASKALGGLGGIVTASQAVIDFLVNTGRPMMYTTAPPPAQVATLTAALEVVRDEPERRERLLEISNRVRAMVCDLGWPIPESGTVTPIIPLIIGAAGDAVALSKRLELAGFLGIAIRPPTVPEGQSRVRLSLRWDLTDEEIGRLIQALKSLASCSQSA